MTMRIGSLFSGIGGLELGLEWAGVGRTVWQVEIDPFCRAVLAHHWPNATRHEDVRAVGAHNLEPVDVICGGFPCQDISVAGKGAGLAGTRSGLWYEFARIIRELRPQVVVVENVATLLDRGIGDVLGTLAEFGYDAEWSSVSACSVGAPHTRDRLFVVAHASSHGRQRRAQVTVERRTNIGVDALPRHWASEPRLDRVVNGPPTAMAKAASRALGNAVVPQCAEIVGRRLLELVGAAA